jgi:hypothetical protein
LPRNYRSDVDQPAPAAFACGFEGNTDDAEALTGSEIRIDGHTGATNIIPALNTRGADGSLVTDGDLQGDAVVDATDAATAISQLNLALARLRAAGVIAT